MERDGFLKPQRIAETMRTLKMFRKLCDAYGIEKIIAVATAAVRRAKNQRSFLDEVATTCGIKFRVLSAEEEAVYVYRGVINTMDIPKGVILEIGGGSTKIVRYVRKKSTQLRDFCRSARLRLPNCSPRTGYAPKSRPPGRGILRRAVKTYRMA